MKTPQSIPAPMPPLGGQAHPSGPRAWLIISLAFATARAVSER